MMVQYSGSQGVWIWWEVTDHGSQQKRPHRFIMRKRRLIPHSEPKHSAEVQASWPGGTWGRAPPSLPSWRELMSLEQTRERGQVLDYLKLTAGPCPALSCPAASGAVSPGAERRHR